MTTNFFEGFEKIAKDIKIADENLEKEAFVPALAAAARVGGGLLAKGLSRGLGGAAKLWGQTKKIPRVGGLIHKGVPIAMGLHPAAIPIGIGAGAVAKGFKPTQTQSLARLRYPTKLQ